MISQRELDALKRNIHLDYITVEAGILKELIAVYEAYLLELSVHSAASVLKVVQRKQPLPDDSRHS